MFERFSEGKIYSVAHKLVEKPDINKYFRHIHPFCELLLVISGDVEFNIDGKIYPAKPYDLIIIPKAEYHNVTAIKPIPYENYVIDFYSDILPQDYVGGLFDFHRTVNIGNDRVLLNYFRLLDLYDSMFDEEEMMFLTEKLMCETVMYLNKNIDNYKAVTVKRSRLVQMILDEIAMNLTEKIDVAYLSEKLSFSQSYIQNIFSKQMKIGLKQYIMQKKIFASQSDIADGMTPTEAAEKYGFGDYSSFYRQYKKHIGLSPRSKQDG